MTAGVLIRRTGARPRPVRLLAGFEAVVLALAAAALILGRAGFVGSPISYVVVSGHSMEPTFYTGDVVVLRRSSAYHPGEVIGYRVPKGGPGAGLIVIHRVIGGNALDGYLIQGDNKTAPDPWRPRPADVVGHEIWSAPKIGLWIAYLRTPLGLAALAGLVTLTFMLAADADGRRPEKREGGSPEPVTPAARKPARGAALQSRLMTVWRRVGGMLGSS